MFAPPAGSFDRKFNRFSLFVPESEHSPVLYTGAGYNHRSPALLARYRGS
jgi:hypothetical protein